MSGNNLFVANYGSFGNAKARLANTTPPPEPRLTPNFITGLQRPFGLALSGNNLFVAKSGLFVANYSGGTTVGEYDATTGAAINPDFITGLNQPYALAVAAVPEPSTWSMIPVGGVALPGMMIRKKHRIAY